MAFQNGGIVIFLSCIWLHYSQSSSLSVPLLTWSNSATKLKVPSVITAGQTKELSAAYKEHIEPLVKSKPLVLFFLQDELSADDFTKYTSSFPHLQQILETKEYLFLPSVSKEKKGLNELISGSTSDVEYVDTSNLGDWKYTSEHTANKIIIFHLEPVGGTHSEGKGEILKRNDLIMHRITKLVKEQVHDFGIVYSAEDPSEMIADILLNENIEDPGLSSRHLLGAKSNTTRTFFNNTCVLLYARSIRHTFNNENTTEFIVPGQTWKLGGCGSQNLACSISLTREGNFKNYTDVTLLIEFKNDTYSWYCVFLRFSGKYKGQDFDSRFQCGGGANSSLIDSGVYNTISAPDHLSFACHDLTFSTNGSITGSSGSSVLTLGGVQVETACDGKGGKKQFSAASHCVGFFTIEILTVIFVTIILMMGLYVGVMMMMAIQVQERLDDPKGKTITVVTFNNE